MTLLKAVNKVFSMYITVLDFYGGRVHQYHLKHMSSCEVNDIDSEQIEDFLTGEGHSLSNIEWMSHSDGEIITENGDI
tara:strand:- start:978 stop:1211 length:234 start_codon:yes stop_codon:yes gene_type:complete